MKGRLEKRYCVCVGEWGGVGVLKMSNINFQQLISLYMYTSSGEVAVGNCCGHQTVFFVSQSIAVKNSVQSCLWGRN